MILMKMVVVSINVANANKEYARNLPHPVEEPVGGIAACKRGKDCLAFVYTPAPKNEHVPSAEVSDADFAESMGAVENINKEVNNILRAFVLFLKEAAQIDLHTKHPLIF